MASRAAHLAGFSAMTIEDLAHLGLGGESTFPEVVGASLERFPILIRQRNRLTKFRVDREQKIEGFVLNRLRPTLCLLQDFTQLGIHRPITRFSSSRTA